MSSKYVIKNATVVSVDPQIGTVENCDVTIEGGVITGVGPDLEFQDHTIIDGTNSIVSPGFVDTHRHTWQTQMRTVASDYVLSDYILALRHIYGASYSPHDAYIGNLTGALESINNGITYLVDHCHIANSPDHAEAALRGLREAKIRASFCYAMYANPIWAYSDVDKERETKTPKWRLGDVRRIKEKYFQNSKPEDLLQLGFALSEPDFTPIEQLESEIKFARSLNAAVITGHFSFGKWDSGKQITRQLGERGLLGRGMVLSHGNTLTDEELRYVKKSGAGLSTTPDTELQMGMSHPVAFRAKDIGAIAALGVDVCCSSPGDMFAQMRLLIQAQRHLEHDAGSGPPLKMSRYCADVLEMATMGGARAVNLENLIGSITPGKRADILITRCDSPRLVPVHDPIGALVLYANGSDIDTVFIDGRIVKSGGTFPHVDWPKLREDLRASTSAVMKMAKKAPMDELEASRKWMVEVLAGSRKENINQEGEISKY